MKIQTQLTAVVAVVVAFVVALAGVVIVMRNDHTATDQVDRLLSDKAAVVRAAAVKSGTLPTDGSYAVRLIAGGKLLKQAGTSTQFPLPTSDGYTSVTAAGSEWRSFSETLISGGQMQILVSLTNVREQHTSNVLKVDLLVVLAALLSAAGVWFATGRVLRPFQRLMAAARSLGPGDRLPEPKSPREVAELSATLNEMLDRVQAEPEGLPRALPSGAPADSVTTEIRMPHPPASWPGSAQTSGSGAGATQPSGAASTSGSAPTSVFPTVSARNSASSPTSAQNLPSGSAPDISEISGQGFRRSESAAIPERQAGAGQADGHQQNGLQPGVPQPGGPEVVPLDLDELDTSLRPQLDGLGLNLDSLMDNPDMPATQRHLILAMMADEHREIVAELDRLRAQSEG